MARLTQAELADLNRQFDDSDPRDLIRWAKQTFGDRLAALSSMQKTGCAVCHMLSTLDLGVPVLFVDTGVLFPEAYATRDRIAAQFGLEVRSLTPTLSMEEQTTKYGVLYLTAEGQAECCRMRKSDPLLAIAGQFDGLISSLRRSDGGPRGRTPVLSLDPETNTVRVNPLVTWNDDTLAGYLAEHDIPTNPLHEQGYATIGCNRCTTPVLPGEPKRAGRWRHLGPWSQYCGINPTDVGDPTQLAVELPEDVIDRVLGREADFVI